MDIKFRSVQRDKYGEVVVKYDGATITTGFLDTGEMAAIAGEFLMAFEDILSELVQEDKENFLEDLQRITNQLREGAY